MPANAAALSALSSSVDASSTGQPPELGNTLGSQDGKTNLPRLRADLKRHGAEICSAHAHYEEITIKAGSRRAEYWLVVRRSRDWALDRQRRRRRDLSVVA